jgi:glucosamine 6-phosphate synthetase-like amidotransferase/phosphosugar isomerase protein
MCGIAGYSLSTSSAVDRTLAAQSLLAGIAERGADAVGYAHRSPGTGAVEVHKQRTGASELLDRISIPRDAVDVLVHVRDYTKGHPSIPDNNHPIRHGTVVGIHNGIIENDDEVFERNGFARATSEMTVDSEAIFAVAEASENRSDALEQLYGAMATAWIDERRPDVLFLARGVGRPLWIGRGHRETFFASTEYALETVERYAGVKLQKREIGEGTMLALADGRVAWTERFRPDESYVEHDKLPAVRAPHEGVSCLERLAVLAAATA